MNKQRSVFYVSDSTGITAETLGNSLLTQFESFQFNKIYMPSVNTLAKAEAARARIDQQAADEGVLPLVFLTLNVPAMRDCLLQANGQVLDLFTPYLQQLEQVLGCAPSYDVGRSHGAHDYSHYMQRINAVDYTLISDDGASRTDYGLADCILVGVSRCGKTPTSLYLALQFGLRVANYPLTEEDMPNVALPTALQPHKAKIYGLTIDPQRLSYVRFERRGQSRYASMEQCLEEVNAVEKFFRREHIPFTNTTTLSVEEIATDVLMATGITKRL